MAPGESSGPKASAATNIDNIPASQRVYLGARADGYLNFYSRGPSPGFDVVNTITGGYASMGPAAMLALGLTECCARFGRGKVFHFIKPLISKATLTRDMWPDEYISLPELIFTDYIWTEAESIQWLQSPHWQRLDLLNARGNALSISSPVVPVTLCWETKTDYSNINFFQGLAPVMLYCNDRGAVYMGLHEDLSHHAKYFDRAAKLPLIGRRVWYAEKEKIPQFQMRSGNQVLQELLSLYQSRRPGVVFVHEEIVKESIQAHHKWVANGGYTIASDKDLGPDVAAAAELVRNRRGFQNTVAPAREQPDTTAIRAELRDLRVEVAAWPASVKEAYADFINAANRGVSVVVEFTISNINWQDLSVEHKRKILRLWELEQEVSTVMEVEDQAMIDLTAQVEQETLDPPEHTSQLQQPSTSTRGRATRARGNRGRATPARARGTRVASTSAPPARTSSARASSARATPMRVTRRRAIPDDSDNEETASDRMTNSPDLTDSSEKAVEPEASTGVQDEDEIMTIPDYQDSSSTF
ncbi:hypothetical protein LTR84_012886 [Exophiala bonariae]|uniref:PNPLA domain-containing protein n=1 Tax=Exophiala bonariae TaxID=1690606 RepID=A0AAV9NFH7_9EURO|nr:hypothetical protein LTR84_012886 [Exophiala bonariae]